MLGILGLILDDVRQEVLRFVGEGEDGAVGQIPFTPRAKKVLEFSLREALSLGHNYVGTEHVLLGLVRESEGVAARILLGHSLSAEKIRNEIIRTLALKRMTANDVRAATGLKPVMSTGSSSIQVGTSGLQFRPIKARTENLGWECPRCASVYAPFVEECSRCTKAAAA